MNPPFPSVISKIHARGELRDILFQRGAKRPFQNNAKQKVKAYTHMLWQHDSAAVTVQLQTENRFPCYMLMFIFFLKGLLMKST